MDNIVNWVSGNWATVIQYYLAAVGIASIVVKLTPTTKDDSILNAITGFIGKWVALNPEKKV